VKVLVAGQGCVGKACVTALTAAGHEAGSISARGVLAGDNPPPADRIVFAHGKPVTVKRFAESFDDLLASRVAPMAPFDPATPAILISSTVACLPSPPGVRDLPALQRNYEAAFLARWPDGSILRLGAMRGPGWQIDRGLEPLRRTVLLKRLRMTGRTDIPWADDRLLSAALRRAVETPVRAVVAHGEGFDVNPFLDSGLGPLAVRLPLPDAWFRAAYEGMGAPPQFLRITTADVRVAGWTRIDTPA